MVESSVEGQSLSNDVVHKLLGHDRDAPFLERLSVHMLAGRLHLVADHQS